MFNFAQQTERCSSGLRGTLGKRMYSTRVPGVRIPFSPQKRGCLKIRQPLFSISIILQMNNPHRKRSGYQGIVSIRRKRWGIYPKRLNPFVLFRTDTSHLNKYHRRHLEMMEPHKCQACNPAKWLMESQIYIQYQLVRVHRYLNLKDRSGRY